MAVSVAQDAQLSRRVESRHIDHIPAGARHGQPWHRFAFWFGGNVNVFNVVVGAVTVLRAPGRRYPRRRPPSLADRRDPPDSPAASAGPGSGVPVSG